MNRREPILGGAALMAILAYGSPRPAAAPASPIEPPIDQVKAVSSSRVLIWFQAANGGSPVTKVDVWYTLDRGESYQLWKNGPEQVSSPVAFEAEQDGLYGVYLVLHNQHGPSSQPPRRGAEPHRWVLVDGTAPLVQITQIRPDPSFAQNREVEIRWNTSDANLPDRPVSLHYRTDGMLTFQPIADHLSAGSWHRWVVPEGAGGRIIIKATARDEAGNVGNSEVDALKIEGGSVTHKRDTGKPNNAKTPGGRSRKRGIPMADAVSEPAASLVASDRPERDHRSAPRAAAENTLETSFDGSATPFPYAEPDAGQTTLTTAAVEAAKKKYDLATRLRDRGDHALALVRYREALELDPNKVDARHDLASLLFVRGQYESAEQEFECVLALDPQHAPALKRLALSRVGLKKFASAREPLERMLRLDAKDAEGWLCLGDVTFFLGDREAAREYWLKARSLSDPQEGDVYAKADKRLETYRGGSLALGS